MSTPPSTHDDARLSDTPENPLFNKIRHHLGHRIEVASYGGSAIYGADEKVAVECRDCYEVVVDVDKYENEPGPILAGFVNSEARGAVAAASGALITNLQRAAWAEIALSVFIAATTPNDSTPRTMVAADFEDSIADLICDLLHYAEAHEIAGPLDILTRGRQMFEDEREGGDAGGTMTVDATGAGGPGATQ